MKKSISCGVIITDGKSVVLGHVTNHKHWDIPKGGVDSGESLLAAAVRELKEETGLEANPSDLVPLGIFGYKPKKDLAIYLWRVNDMPDPKTLKCHSTFVGHKGHSQPELDGFVVVDWLKAESMVNSGLATILAQVRDHA